ncbi:NUDIX hydrolase [Saccharospirillum sp. HFRX-1]|uniref:NUDIX hydrolase n=1 Tax=unclassified Saccharospirillum TaxID=2633430 RepID=UPI003719D5F0
MNFCSHCGQPLRFAIPDMDNRPRYLCDHCGSIHYQNPRLITGTLPVAPDGRILLCRRAIEPRLGYWTLPAGFMENGETVVEGALRETLEESMVKAHNPVLLSMISLPEFDQVHVFYRVDMPDFEFSITQESSEVALFELNDLPWQEIAFRTITATLEHYLKVRDQEVPAVLTGAIEPR